MQLKRDRDGKRAKSNASFASAAAEQKIHQQKIHQH
jgi:hypothetical protein